MTLFLIILYLLVASALAVFAGVLLYHLKVYRIGSIVRLEDGQKEAAPRAAVIYVTLILLIVILSLAGVVFFFLT